MQEQQYKTELEQAGLSVGQALVYETLLERGSLAASVLTRHLPYSRQMAYTLLDELEGLDLVEKMEKKGSVTKFAAAHPAKLRDVLARKQKEAETAADKLEAIMPSLSSQFNILSGKPGVNFMEGQAGVEQVLAATLENKDEVIYTYADIDAIEKYAKTINDAYMKKRLSRGVGKKILMMDSPLAREKATQAQGNDLTEIKLISADQMPSVPAVIEIHNGKVVYITFTKGILTTTTLHDHTLYTLHRFLFESHWRCASAPATA